MLVIASSKVLQKMLYIKYPVQFKENQPKIKTLINSSNKVNAMTSVYIAKLDLTIWETNVKAQKIDGSSLEIYNMVLAKFFF